MSQITVTVTPADTPAGVYHFLQTPFWAKFKAAHGWKAYRFNWQAECDATFGGTVSVLVRQFARLFSIAYIPLGLELPDNAPFTVFDPQYQKLLASFASAVRPQLPGNLFCIRMDPPVEFTDLNAKSDWISSLQHPLKKSPTDIQPPDTVLLDIRPEPEALLAGMKPKWRYNVKLAEKKGVTVEKCGAESVDRFYGLFEETASRDGIAVHAKSYYRDILERGAAAEAAGEPVKVTLYIAVYEDMPIAGIITLFTKTESVYLYGASSNQHRNVMPAYLLQWTVIQDARDFGAQVYDFYGCPPTDDEHHPMHGLFRFKNGFGGQLTHRAGSIDYPVKKVVYGLYITAEKLRAFWFKRVKKLFK